jgi:hypothetical protein
MPQLLAVPNIEKYAFLVREQRKVLFCCTDFISRLCFVLGMFWRHTKMCTYACEIKNLLLGWNVLALMQPAGSAGITY